jgi:hypothetical protein
MSFTSPSVNVRVFTAPCSDIGMVSQFQFGRGGSAMTIGAVSPVGSADTARRTATSSKPMKKKLFCAVKSSWPDLQKEHFFTKTYQSVTVTRHSTMDDSHKTWSASGDAVAAPTEVRAPRDARLTHASPLRCSPPPHRSLRIVHTQAICAEIIATCAKSEALMAEAMACVDSGDLEGARAKKSEADTLRQQAESRYPAAQAERAKIPPIAGRPGQ